MLTDAFDALRALPTAAAAALLCYVPLALLLAADGHDGFKQGGQGTLHGRIVGQGSVGGQLAVKGEFSFALVQGEH